MFDSRDMLFELLAFRFHFEALDPVRFPEGKSGNIVRGAFGTIFREIACVPECRDVRTCPRRVECAYARIFEPHSTGGGPSGFSDQPRPFVFRAFHLDGTILRPGEPFHFDVNLFDIRHPAIDSFVAAFARLAERGLGPGRGRARLLLVEQLDASGHPATTLADPLAPPIAIDLASAPSEVRRLRICFLTPTELKSGERLAPKPDFAVLFARVRDRISALRTLYGSGPLQIDFRAAGARAAAVQMTRCDLRWEKAERRSSRTGQTHPLGGFTGQAEYEGELAEFVPFLEAAAWTGVGRQTVWGKGAIRLETPP